MFFHAASPRPRRRQAIAVLALGLLGAGGIASLPAHADDEFVVGSGRADARILRVGPAAAQLALAPTIGLSLADYLGTLGRGEARVADYAALDGSIPPELKAEAPELRSESTEENAAAGKTQTFAGTPEGSPITVGAMEQKSWAAADPKGSSSVRLGAVGIPGVLEMGGSVAESSAGVIAGKTREARSSTRISTLTLGGVVTLNGLTWEAVQRTGEGATVDGGFRVDGLTIAGTKVAVPAGGSELGAVLPQINAALAPTGLVLDAPVVTKEGDFARVSPLGIRIVNSQVGQQTVAPVLGALQPVREPVTAGLIENCADCSTAILVADVLAGVVSGGGRFDIELGGVTGFTEGTKYESPFDFDFTGLGGATNDFAGGLEGGTSSLDGEAPTSSFGGAGSSLGGGSDSASGSAAAPGVGTGSTATGTLATTSRQLAGTKGGAAVLVGLVGLLGAIALGAADLRAIRTARRTIPS